MTSHERGVYQAVRVLGGESLTAAKLMRDYGVSRATAKRDMQALRAALQRPAAQHGRRCVVSAWEMA
jgi:predicted DNA-binding transcriptional regulator YafY